MHRRRLLLTFEMIIGVVMTAGMVIWLLWELFCALSGAKHWDKYQDFEFEPREGILVSIKESWKVKKGVLQIKTNASTPMGGRVIKMYFNRP